MKAGVLLTRETWTDLHTARPHKSPRVCALWASPVTKLCGKRAVSHMFLAAPESLCLPSLLPLRCPPGKGPVHIHPHPRPSQIPAHWTIMRTLNCPTHLMDEDAKAQAGLRFPGSQDECRGCRDLHSGPRGCNCLEPLSTRCSRRSRSVPLRRHRDCRFPCPQLPRSGSPQGAGRGLGWRRDQPGTGTLGFAAVSGPHCPGRLIPASVTQGSIITPSFGLLFCELRAKNTHFGGFL